MNTLRFKVFGRLVAISGKPGAWQAFYPGSDGTRRPAGFVIPADITEDGLAEYLADLFHEDATPRRNTVELLVSGGRTS
ncbi:hypothetical protein [Massilia sp. BSC265]|uniref:DUF7661 family protein n=1 Tax=Massilia sp. BSC265 TaxID=1549812 RepID=UPI0004E881EE|nr:hypothetical protein [Massilia sp. BSC265]KFI06125.1 hypothetical protein JN27_18680 [Massilia sp. BSC265]